MLVVRVKRKSRHVNCVCVAETMKYKHGNVEEKHRQCELPSASLSPHTKRLQVLISVEQDGEESSILSIKLFYIV